MAQSNWHNQWRIVKRRCGGSNLRLSTSIRKPLLKHKHLFSWLRAVLDSLDSSDPSISQSIVISLAVIPGTTPVLNVDQSVSPRFNCRSSDSLSSSAITAVKAKFNLINVLNVKTSNTSKYFTGSLQSAVESDSWWNETEPVYVHCTEHL